MQLLADGMQLSTVGKAASEFLDAAVDAVQQLRLGQQQLSLGYSHLNFGAATAEFNNTCRSSYDILFCESPGCPLWQIKSAC